MGGRYGCRREEEGAMWRWWGVVVVEGLLGAHEALCHGMANNSANNACQAVLSKFDNQAEQALLYGVRQFSGCVGLEDCLGCPSK